MKPDIHPKYGPLKVICSCGNSFETRSAVNKDVLSVEICSACHPFYTGKQKIVDTAGRVEKFQKRYMARKSVASTDAKTKPIVNALPKASSSRLKSKKK